MKAAQVLAVVALFLLPVLEARAVPPDPGVADAQKRLETARANLAEAVKKIEVDPPDTADLEKARVAVDALKDAIDAGAEHESKDLDYAKAVLAARKELRTRREFVDERRAKVHIFNHRRTIDAAIANLSDRVRRVEGNETAPKDFDEARAAAEAVKKVADEARQFGKQDPKFATYLTETDATVAKQKKAIDDRWVALSAGKHQDLIELSRSALLTAVAPLSKDATDAQFETATTAATLLAKQLEEGKVLEAKGGPYRTEAELARKDLATSRKRMDELWSETGLARLKAEIEPAHKDLTAAAKAMRAKKPTEDQIAEAKTAAIVVRKLVEKFEPQAARIPALAQYLVDVKKTLVEVEVDFEKKSLDAARADVNQALKTVAGRAPTDENFGEANTALLVLEKTIATVHTKDPAMAQPVGDARALIKDGKAAVAKRRGEVDMQRQRTKIEEAKKIAVELTRQIQQPSPESDPIPPAENAIKLLKSVLDEGAAFVKKDSDYAKYDRETKERIVDLTGRIAARRLAIAAGGGRAVLTEAMTALKANLEAAKKPDATDANIEAATKSLEVVVKAVETQTPLEKQDKAYAAHADRVRNDFQRLADGVELAKQVRELRRQTVEALATGASAFDLGSAAPTLRGQKEQYEKAVAQFRSCSSAGASLIRDNRPMETAALFVDGKKSTAKEVIALCTQRGDATDVQLKQVLPLIAFDEGPKKFFEAGKGFLNKSKPVEALKQFDECISAGAILQNRSPELKERKFEVAGSSTSLPELIQACIAQKKALKGK